MVFGLAGADSLGRLVAIYHRHAAVHQDEVEDLGEGDLGGLAAIDGDSGADAQPRQRLHGHLAIDRAVVGDQHAAAGEVWQRVVLGAGLLDQGVGKAAADRQAGQDGGQVAAPEGLDQHHLGQAGAPELGRGRIAIFADAARVHRSGGQGRKRIGIADDRHRRDITVAADACADFRAGADQIAAYGRAGGDPGQGHGDLGAVEDGPVGRVRQDLGERRHRERLPLHEVRASPELFDFLAHRAEIRGHDEKAGIVGQSGDLEAHVAGRRRRGEEPRPGARFGFDGSVAGDEGHGDGRLVHEQLAGTSIITRLLGCLRRGHRRAEDGIQSVFLSRARSRRARFHPGRRSCPIRPRARRPAPTRPSPFRGSKFRTRTSRARDRLCAPSAGPRRMA